ncbi:MAG: YitT family protein, partial [Bacteroidales bacterium]
MKRPGTAWDSIRSYLISTLGLMILAIAWAGFLIPSDVTGGGASGLATLIFFSTDIPVGYSLIVLNLGLFYLASLKVSKAFALRSVYGVATLSVMLILFQR